MPNSEVCPAHLHTLPANSHDIPIQSCTAVSHTIPVVQWGRSLAPKIGLILCYTWNLWLVSMFMTTRYIVLESYIDSFLFANHMSSSWCSWLLMIRMKRVIIQTKKSTMKTMFLLTNTYDGVKNKWRALCRSLFLNPCWRSFLLKNPIRLLCEKKQNSGKLITC